MKKLILLLVGMTFAAGFAAQAAAETTLRMNMWLPPKHFVVTKGYLPWIDKIKKGTKGNINIQLTTKSLGAPPRQYDLARQGVADIAWGVQGYTAGRFITAEIGELPFNGNSGEALSVAFWRTHQKFFAKANEYKGVKLLSLHLHSPGQLMVNKKGINNFEDLKGLKIRILNSLTAKILKLYGGVPFRGSAPKSYEFFSKGIIDGSFMTNDGVLAFKLKKFAKSFIEVPGGVYNSPFFLVMNQAKWDALSASDKKVIEAASGEAYAKNKGAAWDHNDRLGTKLVKESTQVSHIKGDKLAALKKKLAFLEESWIKRVAAKGVDGAAALKYLRAQAAAYK